MTDHKFTDDEIIELLRAYEVAEAIVAAGYCRYDEAAITVLEKLGRSVNKSRAEYMHKANETPSEDLYIVYRAKAAEDYSILQEINCKRSQFIEKRIKANGCEEV